MAEIPSLGAFFSDLISNKSLSSMNSICERLQSFLKTQVMHMISTVTFVSTCDNDATHHLSFLEPENTQLESFSAKI